MESVLFSGTKILRQIAGLEFLSITLSW